MKNKTEIAIEVKNVTKKYKIGQKNTNLIRDELTDFFKNVFFKSKNEDKDFIALNDVSFKITKGETVGIIGSNGSGKSTILKILSKITYPTTGSVKLNGRVASLLEVGTGFNPELTGRENIYLNGAILGMSKSEIENKFEKIVEFSEIGQFLDTPVKRYSSGMYIRLAFSIASHLDSDILLIDEVLSVGDASFQKKSMEKIKEITHDSERTVIFVSHDLNAVRQLCDKVLLIENGHIKKSGNPNLMIKYYLSNLSVSNNSKGNFDLSKRKRMGSGEVVVKSISVSKAVTGKTFDVQLDYVLHEKIVEDVLVGILIKNELGETLFVTHCVLSGVLFPKIIKNGTFVLTIPKLPLLPGKYYANYSLLKNNGANGEYFDNVDEAFSFVVTGDDKYDKLQGSFYVDGEWRVM